MWQHGGKYNKSRSVLVLLLEEILHLLISIDNEYTSQVVQEFFHPYYHLNHIRYPDRFDPPWLQTKATSDPWQSSSSPQQRGVSMSYKKIGYKVMNTNPIHFFETGSGIKYTAYSTFFSNTHIDSANSPSLRILSFPTRWLSTIVTFMPL